jgi:hypothetical protein
MKEDPDGISLLVAGTMRFMDYCGKSFEHTHPHFPELHPPGSC